MCMWKVGEGYFWHRFVGEWETYKSKTGLFIVDWSLSGIMTSKLVIRESESPRPAASSILISRMTSSLVIIPYITEHNAGAIS